MLKRTNLYFFLVLAFLLTFFVQPSTAQDVRIGVLAKRGADKVHNKWGPTAEYLSKKLAIRCVLVPLNFVDIEPALKNNRIDFLLANSAFFAQFQERYDLKAITTIINRKQDVALDRFGGVLFTTDDSPINVISDIRGKHLMCVKYSSFGGAQMAWRLILEQGIDPKKDCASFTEGGTHDNVVMAVKAGKADVGTVRSDTLERMASEGKIQMSDFKIINQVYDSYKFVHSTRLYPEWPLAACSHTDPKLARKLAKALMLLPNSHEALVAAKVYKWTYPADYSEVTDCLRKIGMI